MSGQDTLSNLLSGILAGTADIGLKTLPALKAFALHKGEAGWKVAAVKQWLEEDPEALPLLVDAIEPIKDRLPEEARIALIMALGGSI
jgi:hypothetical protein